MRLTSAPAPSSSARHAHHRCSDGNDVRAGLTDATSEASRAPLAVDEHFRKPFAYQSSVPARGISRDWEAEAPNRQHGHATWTRQPGRQRRSAWASGSCACRRVSRRTGAIAASATAVTSVRRWEREQGIGAGNRAFVQSSAGSANRPSNHDRFRSWPRRRGCGSGADDHGARARRFHDGVLVRRRLTVRWNPTLQSRAIGNLRNRGGREMGVG